MQIEDLSLEYIAGMMDTAGKIELADFFEGDKDNPIVEVMLPDKRVAMFFKKRWRANVNKHDVNWLVKFGVLSMQAFLPEILPHLRIKDKQAVEVLGYLNGIPNATKV